MLKTTIPKKIYCDYSNAIVVILSNAILNDSDRGPTEIEFCISHMYIL